MNESFNVQRNAKCCLELFELFAKV